MVNQIQFLRPKQTSVPTHESSARLRRVPFEKTENSTPFQQVAVTVWGKKWLVLGMAILGGILTGFAGMARSPLYEASTQMIVDLPGNGASTGTANAPQDMLAAIVDGHLTVLSSEAHLRNVLAVLRKADEEQGPAHSASAETEPGSIHSAVLAMVQKARAQLSSLLWGGWFGPQAPAATPQAAEAVMLKALKDQLRVGQELRSRIISIGFTDRDPARAAQVANTVATVYVDNTAQQNRASDQRDLASIVSRLSEMQGELARATDQLQTYRLTNGAPDRGSADDNGREIVALGQQISLVKANLAAVEARLERVRDLRKTDATATELADAIGSPVSIDPLAGAADDTGVVPATESVPDHLAIAREIERQIARLDVERHVYQAQVASLEERSGALKAAAADAVSRLSGLRALELQADVVSQRYNDLLTRQQDLLQRVGTPRSDVAILSAAWPPARPVTLSPIFLVPPGAIVFGLAAAVLVLVRRRFDRTLHSAAEAEAALGIPCVSLLPRIVRPRARRLCGVLLGQHKAPYTRAVGSLLISLANARLRLPGIILVMASDSGEDKTSLAWSLALTAARLGERVLFLDFDQQGARMTREFRSEFSTSKTKCTVADFLIGNRPLPDTVEDMPEIRLSFMPAPPNSHDVLHLVSTADAVKIMDRLREKYSVVIIDGPSGLAGPETRYLASWADVVLLAVRWGETPRNIARNVLEFIGVEENLPWNPPPSTASVLTQVNLKQHARYRFGDGGDVLVAGR
ncbi:exopolysaccharide biosynthesis protein [Mesorhizobium sp. SARCC-RB16n]|uniref:GumC family protein n=1 Tax=Mesorhizobium sp. SARCC-RB16n TaxID=2116687 RepID=UPI00122F5394|nr:polysaccharide biosynthesis tyrosine autokinase [Mesorhizobium sp. SARCC-RB16n]KAA3441996.1 exopolysaccharide biosynthesis protein [Mesorhizobium sp. SARCC-RB16n]